MHQSVNWLWLCYISLSWKIHAYAELKIFIGLCGEMLKLDAIWLLCRSMKKFHLCTTNVLLLEISMSGLGPSLDITVEWLPKIMHIISSLLPLHLALRWILVILFVPILVLWGLLLSTFMLSFSHQIIK